MDKAALIQWFISNGCTPDELTPGYTSRLIRCGCGRHAWAAVECGEDGPARVVKDFGAALDWGGERGGGEPLTFIIGTDAENRWQHAAEAIALIKPTGVTLLADGEPHEPAPVADLVPADWSNALLTMRTDPPDTLLEVEQGAASLGFRWQRTVTGNAWSGRLLGLEICTVRDSDGVFRFDVGAPGKQDAETGGRAISAARQHFQVLLNAGNFFRTREDGVLCIGMDQPATALAVVQALAEGGLISKGSAEHHLEALVNQGRHILEFGGRPIDVVFPRRPFQFPTRWWRGGHARYVDVLGRQGSTPWVVELKVDLGQGEYYRDGIVQVALYKQFVLRARALEEWFTKHDLDRSACRAALVIPPLRGPDALALERRHRALAARLGVELMTSALSRDVLASAS